MAERVRLVLVRHGETVGHSSIRYYGRTDVALSELGRRQMRAARAWLEAREGARGFAPVFTSPLVRATEGARIIAGRGAAAFTIGEFVEVDFGLFEGLTAEEIAGRYPDEFRRWNSNRLAADFVYPEGESRAGFVARVVRGVTRMLASWQDARASGLDGSNALLVAHRGVIRAVVRRLTGALEPHIDLGSIHILEQEPGGADLRIARWRPVALDLTEHLDAL
ncbi:MAG TPA: histidine phosphatase family protein [Candidatus Binataceae bacterium]|nr:histidine phosphatase family protein [Candidatus Binataceae bacterium]